MLQIKFQCFPKGAGRLLDFPETAAQLSRSMQPVKASLLPSEGDFSRAMTKRRYKSCCSKGDKRKPNWLWPAQSYTVSRASPHVEISKFSTTGFPKPQDKPLLHDRNLAGRKIEHSSQGKPCSWVGFLHHSLLSQWGTAPTQSTKRQEWCWTLPCAALLAHSLSKTQMVLWAGKKEPLEIDAKRNVTLCYNSKESKVYLRKVCTS